ncbi:MAG: FKBP-type peptidyl-prolyl cis-trans isomerase [Paludibacteraceae bacterium]
MERFTPHNVSKVLAAIIVVLCFLSISACKKQTAQFPSNKSFKVDSADLSLQEHNRKLIAIEDSILTQFAKGQSLPFVKSYVGLWYFEKTTEAKSDIVSRDSVITLSYDVYDFAGNLLQEIENKTIHLGKKEVPAGLEEGLKITHGTKSIRLIIPSYLGYGSQGNDKVKPNTSLYLVVTVQ